MNKNFGSEMTRTIVRFFGETACRFIPLLPLFAVISLLSFFQPTPTSAQGWQTKPVFDNYDFAKSGHPTPDGGFIIAGETGPDSDLHNAYLLKLDPFGNEQWRKIYGGPEYDAVDDIELTSDGGYIMTGTTISFSTGGSWDAWLIKTDRFGEVEWQQVYGGGSFEFGRQVIQTSDGGYAFTGRIDDGADVGILVVKTDSEGNQEWLETYGGIAEDEGWSIAENADNQLVIVATTRSFGLGERDIYVATVSLAGDFLGFETFGGTADDLGTDIIATSDGGLLIGGATASMGAGDYDVILIKTNADATSVDWQQTYGGALGEWGAYLTELPDGYAFCASTKSFGNLEDDLYLVRTDFSGDQVWQRFFGAEKRDVPHSISYLPNGGFLITGHSRVDTFGAIETSQNYLVQANAEGLALSNFFQGKIFDDLDGECDLDSGEEGFENWILTAKKDDGTTFYGSTEANGNFTILTDTGTYVLTLTPPNAYWQPCENGLSLTHTNLDDTLVAYFPLQKSFNCPQLEVDVATSIVRPCENSTWELRYCNHGTAIAEAAYVEITLDSFLSFVSADIAPSGQNGLTYTFELGNLAPGECNSFSITANLDCTVELGRTHCLDALIFPDEICLPPDPLWDGSSIEVSSVCQGDTVVFKIKNKGNGGMSTTLRSIIVEDQIMTRALEFQLGPGDSLQVPHPAFGRTIRMEAQQSPGHPGRSAPSVTEEGCNQSGPDISKGFHTMWPEDDANPFRSLDCRESSLELEPDVKLAFPKGIGPEHLIRSGADIEYLIPFQNIGTDTAAHVVVRDTLSPLLDLTTLRPGSASHPYHWTLSNTGVVQVTFDEIALPNSATNDAASRGFIKFRVRQMPDLQTDSIIFNRSCVFLDYGAPAAKPQTFHTVEKPKVFSISDVNLCTGGLYDGVAVQGDTTFFALNELTLVDSISSVNIMVWPVYEEFFQDSTCANEPYTWLGQMFDTPGIYDSTLMTTFGCDSTLTLTLDHLDVSSFNFQDSTCVGEPYIFGSQILTETGQYEEIYTATNGCDSVVTLELEVLPLEEAIADTSIVFGSYFLAVQIFSDTILMDTIFSELGGCDSVVVWEVSVYTGVGAWGKEIGGIRVFPNPTSGTVNVFWKNIKTPIEGISIFNSVGSRVAYFEKSRIPSGNYFPINIAEKNLPSGIYQIIINTGNKRFSERVIILKN